MEEEFQNDLSLEEEAFTSPESDIETGEDESHESLEDGESTEETVSQETKSEEPDPDKKRKQRIDQLKRDKYRALNRVNQLEKEVSELRNKSDYSNEAAMAHYDSLINMKLEQSRKNLKQAISAGDEELQVQASEELAEIKAESKALESWKAQQKYNNQNVQQNNQGNQNSHQETSLTHNEDANEWLENNQWFANNSPHYDPEMAQEVISYAEALDKKLTRLGQPNKILSREYFNEIDNYVKANFQDEVPISYQQKEMIMKPINNPVSPVGRRTSVSHPTNPKDIQLSAAEKFMAKNAGVSEEDWKKAIIETRQSDKYKGRGVSR